MVTQGRRHNQLDVLVIEDDAAIRALVCEALGDAGYAVAAAGDLPQAVDALARARFDLVLADPLGPAATEPGTDRWAALTHLRDLAGGTPVVIFTAGRDGDFAGFEGRGFSDLLRKPFDLDELLALVRRHRDPHGAEDDRDGDGG